MTLRVASTVSVDDRAFHGWAGLKCSEHLHDTAMASGLSDGVRCLLLGVRDSLAGTLLVVRFVRR